MVILTISDVIPRRRLGGWRQLNGRYLSPPSTSTTWHISPEIVNKTQRQTQNLFASERMHYTLPSKWFVCRTPPPLLPRDKSRPTPLRDTPTLSCNFVQQTSCKLPPEHSRSSLDLVIRRQGEARRSLKVSEGPALLLAESFVKVLHVLVAHHLLSRRHDNGKRRRRRRAK